MKPSKKLSLKYKKFISIYPCQILLFATCTFLNHLLINFSKSVQQKTSCTPSANCIYYIAEIESKRSICCHAKFLDKSEFYSPSPLGLLVCPQGKPQNKNTT
ncbi:hypothetical protein GQR58_010321 [Nymphon striatum]|nr:hypothetical protein GQR58_010321 [Nymphon striatum]